MNLKLKVFDSKKRFENKKLAELENKMDHYFDEDIDETYQVGIILDYISEIEKIKKEDEKLLINGKQIKLIKKFEADILANGGLQSIKPGLLEKIMEAMTNIFELDFKASEYVDEIKDLKSLHDAIIEKEFKQLLEDFDTRDKYDNYALEDVVFKQLESDLVLDPCTLPHFDIIDELLKKFSIDLFEGKNCDSIPDRVFSKMVYGLTTPFGYGYETEVTPQVQEKLAKIIYNYLNTMCKRCERNPTQILVKAPVIMELYNVAASDSFIWEGKEYPSKEIQKISKELLSILPSNIPISSEEQDFMDKCSTEYVDSPMPRADLEKYVRVYLKMILNKISKENSREDNLLMYSETLLAQLGSKDRLSGMYDSIARIAIYDYTKDLLNSVIKNKNNRVTMSLEVQNDAEFAGFFSDKANLLALAPSFSGNGRFYFLDHISTVYHESQHAFAFSNLENAIYKSPIEYSSSKLMVLHANNPFLIIYKQESYFDASYELDARLTEYERVLDFMKRHGIDKIDPDFVDYVHQSREEDLKRMPNINKVYNPTIQKAKIDLAIKAIQFKRKVINTKLMDKDYEETVFDKNRHQLHELKNGPKYLKKFPEGDMHVSILKGAKLSLDGLFDEYISQHLELCKPGSYFSIEYNPDGKRKSLAQILDGLNELDESPENDPKRSVYQAILGSELIRLDEPSKAFSALFNYQSTNSKNDAIVQKLVQNSLIHIVDRMTIQLHEENVQDISKQYQQDGYSGRTYIMKKRKFIL